MPFVILAFNVDTNWARKVSNLRYKKNNSVQNFSFWKIWYFKYRYEKQNFLIRILWRRDHVQLMIWNVDWLLDCQLLRFFLWLDWFIGSAGTLHYSNFKLIEFISHDSLPCYQLTIVNFRRHSDESTELRRGHARLVNYQSALNHA